MSADPVQPSLFDSPDRPYRSHRRGQETSAIAADRAEQSGSIARHVDIVITYMREHGAPITSAELAAAVDIDRVAAARRLPALAHRGIVRRAGTKMCTVCHQPCIAWVLTEATQ